MAQRTSGNIDKRLLAPGVNDYAGGLNAEGVYYIDTAGNDITIEFSRIHGTLVIDAGTNNKVIIQEECFIQPYRDDFPALIIRAMEVDLKLRSNSGVSTLKEDATGHNFNPTGAPYLGQTDSDVGRFRGAD